MRQYLDLAQHILDHGVDKKDRTGTGTKSIFGYQMRFNLKESFPMITTKRLHFKSIVEELLWFLRGETNIRTLQEKGIRIWNEWANDEGELGPVYGYQWRSWPTPNGENIDQIKNVIESIKKDPYSRRHIVSSWNVSDLDKMALQPCHLLFQFNADPNGYLDCQMYQRSADTFLGVPFNISSYSLLTMMVAQETGLKAREFIHTIGDAHIYNNHLKQMNEQLKRDPKQLPTLKIPEGNLDEIAHECEYEHFRLIGYEPHPHIAGRIAI